MSPTPLPPRRSTRHGRRQTRRVTCHREALALASLATALAAAPARADAQGYAGLTATFLHPLGTVTPTEDVDVWVRLSLAADARPFTFSVAAGGPSFGLPAGIVPTMGTLTVPPGGLQPFAAYTAVRLGFSYGCESTFGNILPPGGPRTCGVGPYQFATHVMSASSPDRPALVDRQALTIMPGTSFDFLAGTFRPIGGMAAPGVYQLPRIIPSISLMGVDAQDRRLIASAVLAETCRAPITASCQAFTRTVAAPVVTPEPSTVALLGGGIVLLVGGLGGRRRAQGGAARVVA